MAGQEFGVKGGSAAATDSSSKSAALGATGADFIISIQTPESGYGQKKSGELTDRATSLANMDCSQVPDSGGTPLKDTKWYADLIAEAGEYVADVQRIELATDVFNEFVEPGNLAMMGAKQLRSAATSQGIKDDTASGPEADKQKYYADASTASSMLSPEQQKEMHGVMASQATVNFGDDTATTGLTALDGKVNDAQAAVSAQQHVLVTATIGARQVIIGEQEKKQKELGAAANEKKAAIQAEIALISTSAQRVTDLITMAGGMVFGAGGALEDQAFDMAKGKVNSVIGDPGALVGQLAGGIAQAHYDAQLEALQAKIDATKGAVDSLKSLGVDLSALISFESMKSSVELLKNATKTWADAIERRRTFLAATTKTADQKTSTGKNAGQDSVSQVGVLVADAKDAQTALNAGKAAASNVTTTISQMASGITGHRGKELAVPRLSGDNLYGQTYTVDLQREAAGADGIQVTKMTDTITGWLKKADDDIAFAEKIVRAVV